MKRRAKLSIFLLASAVWCSGCAKDPQAAANAARNEANRQELEKDKFQQQTPVTADTRFTAGQFAEIQNDPPRAIEQYQDALKLDPKHALTLFNLASLYTRQKNFDSAIATWKRYIEATNGSAAGYSNLGFAFAVANRSSEAEAAYKAGIAKDPANQACRVNYGLMLAHLGRIDESVTQLQTVLTPAEAHYNIASVLQAEGKTTPARAEFEKSLKADPDFADAKSRLAALDE